MEMNLWNHRFPTHRRIIYLRKQTKFESYCRLYYCHFRSCSSNMSATSKGSSSSPKFVLRRFKITSFRASSAPRGVANFIESTPYDYKSHLYNTMSGLFDFQIPRQRPEWWVVVKQHSQRPDGDFFRNNHEQKPAILYRFLVHK